MQRTVACKKHGPIRAQFPQALWLQKMFLLFIFCFAAAARWHGSMYVVALDLSTDGPITLLEALTTKHRSPRGKEQQMELLPFTALERVIREESWDAVKTRF